MEPLLYLIQKNTNNLTKFESELSPYWVTGFSDAESTFQLK